MKKDKRLEAHIVPPNITEIDAARFLFKKEFIRKISSVQVNQLTLLRYHQILRRPKLFEGLIGRPVKKCMFRTLLSTSANVSYTGEHVRNWAGDFDTQQSGNTQQKSKEACNERSPEKYGPIPFGGLRQAIQLGRFSFQDNEW